MCAKNYQIWLRRLKIKAKMRAGLAFWTTGDVALAFISITLSQTLAYTLRSRITGLVHLYSTAFAGTHFAYSRGMARLSWPWWLIKYQDGANATRTHERCQNTISACDETTAAVDDGWLMISTICYATSVAKFWSSYRLACLQPRISHVLVSGVDAC